jgi:hypothetical protein
MSRSLTGDPDSSELARWSSNSFSSVSASFLSPAESCALTSLSDAPFGARLAALVSADRLRTALTDAGRELQPILLALKEWGDHHCNPGAEPIIFRHTCGADFHPLTVCAACREPLRDGELTVTGGTHPVQATM